MQEPYRKGVAHHPDPESCAGGRKGAGEALTGAHAGRATELRNHSLGVPTSSRNGEGHTNHSDMRELLERHPGVEEPRHVWKLRARKPGDPTDTPIHGDEGRSAKVTNRTADMYIRGESDGPIVPKKRANNVGTPMAEPVEERGPTKGNVELPDVCRTQGWNTYGTATQRTSGAYACTSRPEVGAL